MITTGGTMIKMPVEDVKRLGRSTQGVIVMRLRKEELVSSMAPVLESESSDPTDDAGLEEGSVAAVGADVLPALPEAVQQALAAEAPYPVADEDDADDVDDEPVDDNDDE